ncbi:hypothetical protein FRC17_006076 [Serendipita sp. 399]|nr:hypothetical protein FRC17_006076 [Serendipita sp. 399]
MFATKAFLVLAAVSAAALAAPVSPVPRNILQKRCNAYNLGLPTPTGTVTSSSVITVAAGATFDGGWKKYDRGSGACNDQAEGGDADAVFLLKAGATLQNVIIGKNQAEGVHCSGPCTLKFVWFEDVCEDAITVKGDTQRLRYRQRQSPILMEIDELPALTTNAPSMRILRSSTSTQTPTANCTVPVETYVLSVTLSNFDHKDSQCKRNVYIDGVEARNGGELAGINSNYGDTATIRNACYDTKTPCQMYIGNDDGDEPTKSGTCSG